MDNGKDEQENTQETQITPTQELTQTQSNTQWRCPCILPTEEGGAK